jgi:RimK family alpha-L-glutamate ligase
VRYHEPVRLLILTARPELATNRRLADAAIAEGVEPLVVDAGRVVAVRGAAAGLMLDDLDLLLEAPDVVIARVGNWRPDSVLAALETAVDAGVVAANGPRAIRIGRDHWLSVRALAAAGLPVPGTFAGSDPEQLAATANRHLGFPVVVKQRRSRMGIGVIRCDRRDQLDAVLDTLWRLGDEVVVQRFVPSEGTTARLVVVGGRVVAAATFTAGPDEWRSNAARGGAVRDRSPDPREEELAIAAAAAVGLGHCGVDVVPGEEPVVLEVNPTPGFRHIEQATGVDVARAIVAHAVGVGARS